MKSPLDHPGASSSRHRESSVERIREILLVLRSVRSTSTRLDTRPSHSIHEVPHGQALANVLRSVPLPSWIKDDHAPLNEHRCQGNVRCHGDITPDRMFRDVLVCDVRTSINADRDGKWVSRRHQKPLIRDEHRLHLHPESRFLYEVLDLPRSGIRVDPDFHILWREDTPISNRKSPEINSMQAPTLGIRADATRLQGASSRS